MKYKKHCLLTGFIILCSVALSGCKSEGEPLSEEVAGEDSQSEISAEKEPPVQAISEWPEPYGKVFVQYKSILEEADDLNVNSVMEKFYEGGEWEYVDIELYLAGRREGIWYSLCDLTNDGFPELILGVRNSGTGAIGQRENGFYNPFAMYFYDKEKDVITYRSFGGVPTTFYEGGVDLSVGSGVTELMMFSQFQEDTMQWEGVVEVGLKWENGELIGYYKLDDDDQEIMISEEEYHHIITQYATTPIELDWHPLDFEQTSQDGNISAVKREDAEADLPLESETSESMNYDDRYTRYFCLEADDPEVQERIAGADDGFVCAAFIRGLAGFSPESNPTGRISFWRRDEEIIIEKNVGRGLLQTERLAEVKETIREMFMDIVRERGRNGSDYKEYFADEVMLQQIETFLSTEIEEDWLLLESFYLSWYAGNIESFYWSNVSEITWKDPENEVTERLTETDAMYLFGFSFYADYRTMECGEYDKAAEIYFDCAVSKETGCIEEISISKTYMHRLDFETMRWT